MANYLEDIYNKAVEIANKHGGKGVTKANLLESIRLTEKKLQIFSQCINSMLQSDRRKVTDIIHELAAQKDKYLGCAEYVNMARALKGRDISTYFCTFETCANNLLTIIDKVVDNIDKMFDNRNIRIENITLGQMAVFGMLEQANIFSKFSSYLLDMVSFDILNSKGSKDLNPVAKYKVEYVAANKDLVYDLAFNLKTGYINYLKDINSVFKGKSNVKLLTQTGETNIGLVDPDEHSGNLFLRKATFNPFLLIGETWVLAKHWLFQRTVKEKEYLESHVALLSLELNGVDPDSKEYQHHVKVINAYNKMIAELDAKIEKYEKS